ncbi:MAG: ribosome silencing factor, partial [Verrucomicrobiota bacterium]|nr:ribosome silencing factor [Verrucomicrobiota bacterium]
MKTVAPPTGLKLAQLCCRVLDDKKAEDLCVLDVRPLSSITDYLIVGTVTSAPHLRALRIELEKALDTAHVRIVGVESEWESGWTVVDAFEVMVHLLMREARERYGLENLWKDAARISVPKLLSEPS